MQKNPVNEHFFDEESKEMLYVLGVSFSRYIPSKKDNRNSWTSSSYDLLSIIQKCLDSNQAIGEPNKWGGRLFQVRSQYLQDKLGELGLSVKRSERTFPDNVKEQYLGHFIRGFFDGNVSVSTDNFTSISYPSVRFLQDIYLELVSHAGIKPGRPVIKSPFNLSRNDTSKAHNFIYQDWEYREL